MICMRTSTRLSIPIRSSRGDNIDKPLLYDVFCGAGGCSKGYQEAGFYVVGIDNRLQPHYCGDDFIQMDAFIFLEKLLAGDYPLPTLISTSPPCQGYTRLKALTGKEYLKLIPTTRIALKLIKRPYVIENVYDARFELENPLMLCGTMFPELRVRRHRVFECSPIIWWPPAQCHHWGTVSACGRGKKPGNETGYIPGNLKNFDFITVAGADYIADSGRRAMGIDWMTKTELSQAIPPAYTRWIGQEMLKII